MICTSVFQNKDFKFPLLSCGVIFYRTPCICRRGILTPESNNLASEDSEFLQTFVRENRRILGFLIFIKNNFVPSKFEDSLAEDLVPSSQYWEWGFITRFRVGKRDRYRCGKRRQHLMLTYLFCFVCYFNLKCWTSTSPLSLRRLPITARACDALCFFAFILALCSVALTWTHSSSTTVNQKSSLMLANIRKEDVL